MKLIFTKSNLPLSVLIRWALNEPVSHFAVVFDSKFVIQSNLLGVQLNWLNTFKKHSEIVFSIEKDLTLEMEEQVYRSLLDNFDGRSYDWAAFFYFMWRAILNKSLGVPIPSKSPYGSPLKFLCTEIYSALPEWLFGKKIDNLNIMSAYKVYKALTSSQESDPGIK